MRVEKRIPFYTYKAKRLLPRIPIPSPKTAGPFIKVQGNCLFRDLKAEAAPPPASLKELPPLLPNKVGRSVSTEDLSRMRELRKTNPAKWTITALSNHFDISRSYVIKKVLSAEEQKQAEDEVIDRINNLHLGQKRGWLLKFKIREHRRDLW